jgi:large subunit ribosomal protein L4
MELKVLKRDGSETGRSVTLDQSVFGIEPNDHAIWLDVRSIQAAGRQGTHKTKERSEVAYSTRKLYRQKGTGNARSGDAKSPVRVGGGTIFGPRPHKYSVGVNRKTKQLARRSALAYKAKAEALRVIEDFQLDAPKTRDIAQMIGALKLPGRKVLLLTAGYDETLYKSGRNIDGVSVMSATAASTLDLMQAQAIVLQEGALEALTQSLAKPEAETAA